jgi:YaiO family outer membrane protein
VKKIIFILLTVTVFSYARVFAEQTEIIKEVQKKEPPRFREAGKEKIYAHSLYEYSWIKQGPRKGNWRIFSNRVAYLKDNLQVLYVDSTGYERFGVKDSTLEFGTYLKLQNGYLHGEFGFDCDHVDYMYKFKGLIELEQRVVNNWFVNLGTRYLHYTSDVSGDVYIFSPALVYYFGNNYVTAGYGISDTQYRDSAQFGTAKAGFALNERVNLWLGAAFGNRLFDIVPLKSNKQYGSIFFGGADIAVTKNITFRIGGSYSKERPSFIKRSIDFGAKVKF